MSAKERFKIRNGVDLEDTKTGMLYGLEYVDEAFAALSREYTPKKTKRVKIWYDSLYQTIGVAIREKNQTSPKHAYRFRLEDIMNLAGCMRSIEFPEVLECENIPLYKPSTTVAAMQPSLTPDEVLTAEKLNTIVEAMSTPPGHPPGYLADSDPNTDKAEGKPTKLTKRPWYMGDENGEINGSLF